MTGTTQLREELVKHGFPSQHLMSGVIVVNFNSPHPFTFVDDSVLDAVSDDIARNTQLNPVDIIKFTKNGITFVQKGFEMSNGCQHRLDEIVSLVKGIKDIIVIVPLPVLRLVKNRYEDVIFATIYVADRISKVNSIHQFCI